MHRRKAIGEDSPHQPRVSTCMSILCTHTHVPTHRNMHTQHTHTCKYAHIAYTCIYTHANIHTQHTHTCKHAHTAYICTHTCKHAHIAYIHMQTCTNSIHIHTYTHMKKVSEAIFAASLPPAVWGVLPVGSLVQSLSWAQPVYSHPGHSPNGVDILNFLHFHFFCLQPRQSCPARVLRALHVVPT